MNFDVALAEKLKERLEAEVLTVTNRLPSAMPQNEYQQACGMLFAWNYVKDEILPALIEELQKG